VYRDRAHAGRVLARALGAYADRPDVLVLALPRGGVPVGFEVARALHAPLDVFVVRKLGLPGHEEFAMGALASGGLRVLHRAVIDRMHVPDEQIEEVTAREAEELARRERTYRQGRPAPEVRGRTVLLIDDGLATGSTMRAAVQALRLSGPARVVVAVPVGSSSTCEALRTEADEVVCAQRPEPFWAVSMGYRDFAQTSDEEVQRLLAQASQAEGPSLPV
jgi:putative phosphoribosyl transferase